MVISINKAYMDRDDNLVMEDTKNGHQIIIQAHLLGADNAIFQISQAHQCQLADVPRMAEMLVTNEERITDLQEAFGQAAKAATYLQDENNKLRAQLLDLGH
jgi:spore cortex formation protein SpoVR/YcgB (stage V sporulation)